ncbi:hypothetical protein Y032_0014g2239 [Ancylostoma ceylanicum]|uniref:Uncharacterized protein n=1 Tax=Ancylostoma ceylanicum TaxID=53326 RepID=A0A016V9L5_9BILA|nr:hypothetical protein Y032_0014g2239 [Ancylostoma ceylanicum]
MQRVEADAHQRCSPSSLVRASGLVGQHCSRGGQPAHPRTAPPKLSVNCTLNPPENGVSATFVTLCKESAWRGDQGSVDISNTRNGGDTLPLGKFFEIVSNGGTATRSAPKQTRFQVPGVSFETPRDTHRQKYIFMEKGILGNHGLTTDSTLQD